ncbi:aminotransferase class I/II-fold pyridoxal phosphate-dependent enzyme [Microlunatus sagamiharensis]|nr:aminotransferase class V-fold PLP-dependent enzyme [Microlunatus sagamiharensis]
MTLHEARYEERLRADAPLLDAYLRTLEADGAPFTIPGHKRNPSMGRVVAGDVPLYGGLDSVSLAGGTLLEAERRAAVLWGADVARFSVGGSTHGNQALALAVGRPGDAVVVPRTLHRSLLLGLVLAGLDPVWLPTRVDTATGLPLGCRAADVERCLRERPDVVAVFVGDPTYVGTVGELERTAAVVHAHGVPLLVDAAWGAHFGFHPALPPHALRAGADALVTSAHKMLTGYSQAALVLARTGRIDPERLALGFEAGNTTSPAGAVLASTDAARALLELDGPALLGAVVGLVAAARARLGEVDGLAVLGSVEPTKLVLGLAGTGADGVAVGRDLREAGVEVEMAERDWLVPIVSLADTPATVDRLVTALVEAVGRRAGAPRETAVAASWSVRPDIVLSPREAFFAAATTVTAREAVGRVCAELVAPYPPGVPVLAPGERVTAEAVESLQRAAAAGTRIAYAADPTIATLRVVA